MDITELEVINLAQKNEKTLIELRSEATVNEIELHRLAAKLREIDQLRVKDREQIKTLKTRLQVMSDSLEAVQQELAHTKTQELILKERLNKQFELQKIAEDKIAEIEFRFCEFAEKNRKNAEAYQESICREAKLQNSLLIARQQIDELEYLVSSFKVEAQPPVQEVNTESSLQQLQIELEHNFQVVSKLESELRLLSLHRP